MNIGKKAIDAAAAAAQGATDMRQEAIAFFASFFGLNGPTLGAMRPSVVPCLCGKCRGIRVQLEVGMHFPATGPALIMRGDAPTKEDEAPEADRDHGP